MKWRKTLHFVSFHVKHEWTIKGIKGRGRRVKTKGGATNTIWWQDRKEKDLRTHLNSQSLFLDLQAPQRHALCRFDASDGQHESRKALGGCCPSKMAQLSQRHHCHSLRNHCTVLESICCLSWDISLRRENVTNNYFANECNLSSRVA